MIVTGHVGLILALKQVKKVKKSDFFPVDSYINNVVSQTAPTTYTSQGYMCTEALMVPVLP